MTRYLLFAAAALSAALCPALAAAQPGSPIEGNWTNPKRSVTVRIAPCGAEYCGRVISADADAKAAAAAGGTARLVGTSLMTALRATGDGTWRGSIFVPDRNVRSEGEVRLTGPRTLEVKGCAISGILCKSQQWTRVTTTRKARRRR